MPTRSPVRLTIRQDPDTGEFYAISYADRCLLAPIGVWGLGRRVDLCSLLP